MLMEKGLNPFISFHIIYIQAQKTSIFGKYLFGQYLCKGHRYIQHTTFFFVGG